MKRWLSLSLFIFLASFVFSQDITKKLEEMDTAFARGKYSQARKLSEIIYPLSAQITNDTLLVEFLGTSGSICYRLEDYPCAERLFLETAEKAKSKLGETDYRYSLALFNLAACYKEQGRYAEAEPLYLKSLPVLATAFGQSSLEYTRCFYTLASLYIDMGRFAEAEGMCAAAVNFYKVILGPASDDYLGAMGSMGIIYQGLAKYDKAEEVFLSLKNYHLSLKDSATKTRITLQTLENNLGELYRHMGDYDRAEPALLNAVALSESPMSAAYSLNNLALVQKALGKYAEAEQSYSKSLSIYKAEGKTNHPDYTNPLNNRGELYRTMGRLQEAVYAFEEVIILRKKFLGTDHPNYANALNNLALVEFAIGMYPEAESHLLECKEIYRKTLGEKDKFYANCLNNLASVYKAQGKLQKAEETYKECLRIFKESNGETSDKYGIYLGGLGGTYRIMKRYDEAIDFTTRSLVVLKNKLGEYHYDPIETEYNLAETYREAGRFEQAETHYLNSMKGYLLLIEKYFPYLSEKDKTAFYYTVANAFATFNSFVIQMRSLYPGKDHAVLIGRMYNNQVALKSLLLKESEKIRTGIAGSTNESLKKEYREWMKLRETIVQQYRLSKEEQESKGLSLPLLERQVNDLEQKITIALKLNTKKNDRKVVLWNDIQAGLKPGECAIEIIRTEYFTESRWTDTVYYTALVIDKTSVIPRFVMIPGGNELESRNLSQYRRLLKAKAPDETSYQAFWEPIQKILGKYTKIYFSPDGVYQQINLYTLKKSGTNKYLLDEMEINLVTNTRDILNQTTASSSRKAEIFSFPDYGVKSNASVTPLLRPGFPDLKELPGTKIEADSVKKILQQRSWTVQEHLQKEATEDAIKKINNPQVLHIATHGFFLKDVKDSAGKVFGIQSGIARQNPLLRSGVILAGAAAIARDSLAAVEAEDGILTAYEAIGLNLTATDLVVLSACETGLGDLLNGQGVYGLQRAFLVAGAKSVIMSLWMIDDFATQELMVNFYREWLKDPAPGNKHKALRSAQLMLKEKYNNPFYWGAFVIVGN